MHKAEQDLGSSPGRTQQDLVKLGGIQQNMVEYGRLPSDCRKLLSRGQSLVAKLVETGRRV